MDPWTILGWMLVALFSLFFLKPLLLFIEAVVELWTIFKQWARGVYLHFRTRNIPPAEGQTWKYSPYGLFDTVRVKRVADNGTIVVGSTNSSWGESPENWTKRVKGRRMYLSHNPEDKNDA
jgi:hypothetical protein